MAVTPDAQTSNPQHYVDFDEYVDFHLAKTRSNIKYTEIFTTLVLLGSLILTYLLTFVVFDQWVIDGGFGYGPRMAMLSVLLLVTVTALVRKVAIPLLKRVNALYAARVIESSDPNLKSSLLNIVDLRNSSAPVSGSMLAAMEKRAAIDLSHVDVEHAVDRRPLLRTSYLLLAVVILACLYTVLSPKDVFSSVKRALLPASPISVATQTTISEVTPGNDRLPARSFLTVEADIRGKAPARVNLLYTTADRKFVDQTIEMRRIEEKQPRFRGLINGENGRGLLQSLKYTIVAGDAHTQEYTIDVIQPPSAKVDEVHYAFPPYMQLEEKTQNGGDIDAWEGATITLKATTNMPVKSAQVIFTDTDDPKQKGEELTMRVSNGTKLQADWKLAFRSDGTAPRFYRIHCITDKGEIDPDPAQYNVKIRPDQAPEIALLAPTGDLEMPANGVVPLVIQAADPDFLLRFITLRAEQEGELLLDQRLFEDQQLAQTFRGDFDFELAPLHLKPGTTIQFWIEAKDNKQPSANRKNTPKLNIKIIDPVSPQAAQRQLAEEKEKQRQDQFAQADEAVNQPDGPQTPDKGAADPQEKTPEKRGASDKADETPNPRADQEPKPGSEQEKDSQTGQDGKATQKKPGAAQNDAEALEKMIRREQQKQQPPSDKPAADSEKQKPSSDSSPGQGKQKGGEKGAKSEQSSADSSSDPNASGKPKGPDNKSKAAGKQPGSGNDKPGKSEPDNSAKSDSKSNSGNKPADSEKTKTPDQSRSEDKQGNQAKKPAAGDKNGTGAKDEASKQDGTKAGEKRPNDKPSSDKPAGNNAPADKPKAGNDDKTGDKTPVVKPDDKSKPGEGANEKSPADKATGDKGPGEKQPGDKKPGEKKPGENGAGDKGPGDKPAADSNDQKSGSDKSSAKPDVSKPDGSKPGQDDQPKPANQPNKNAPGKDKNDVDKKPGDKSGDEKSGDKNQPAPDKPSASEKAGDKGSEGKPSSEKSGEKGEDKNASKPDSSKGPDSEQGKPAGADKSDMPPTAGDPGQTGDKKPAPPPKSGDKNAPSRAKDTTGGKESPAADSPDAVKKQATGDEQDPATPSDEADPNAAKAKHDLNRKPGSEPGAKKPGEAKPGDKQPGAKEPKPGQPGDKPKPGEGEAKNNGTDPKKSRPAPSRKTDQPQEQNPDAHPKSNPGAKSENPDAKTGEQPDASNEPLKGKGRKEGQKSEQPQGGEEGSSKPDDEGQSGGNKPGSGDTVQKPGSGEKSEQPNGGKPSDEKGRGSKTKPRPDGSQSKAGSGESEGKAGSKEGGKEAGKEGGKENGKPGSPGEGKGNQPGSEAKQNGEGQEGSPQSGGNAKEGGGTKGGNPNGNQPGGDNPDASSEPPPGSDEAEQANLDYARKASNLVLKRLKEQIDRGEVDQELLDELGWTKQDMERFAKRLEQQLNEAQSNDDSPEMNAKRLEFEETLKSLRLRSETEERAGDNTRQRRTRQVDARRLPVPAEYREQYEAYTKSLSKQGAAPAAKREPASKK